MSKHGEPWRIEWSAAGSPSVVSSIGERILREGDIDCGPSLTEMQRIVACVNFCAGVPTEKLNEESLREIAEYVDGYNPGINIDCDYCSLGRTIMDISESIKKAEGKDE